MTLTNQSSGEQFGGSVLIADFDGDGTAGAIVGAALAAGGGTNRGRVYWLDNPLGDRTADATFTGGQNTERFGFSLAAGKFGNDARIVLAIGAYLWDKNPANPPTTMGGSWSPHSPRDRPSCFCSSERSSQSSRGGPGPGAVAPGSVK